MSSSKPMVSTECPVVKSEKKITIRTEVTSFLGIISRSTETASSFPSKMCL